MCKYLDKRQIELDIFYMFTINIGVIFARFKLIFFLFLNEHPLCFRLTIKESKLLIIIIPFISLCLFYCDLLLQKFLKMKIYIIMVDILEVFSSLIL